MYEGATNVKYTLTCSINLPSFSQDLLPHGPFCSMESTILEKSLMGTSRHEFMLVAIDYFIKEVDVSSYAKITP